MYKDHNKSKPQLVLHTQAECQCVRITEVNKQIERIELSLVPGVKLLLGVKLPLVPRVKLPRGFKLSLGVKLPLGVKLLLRPGVKLPLRPEVKLPLRPGVKLPPRPGVKLPLRPGVKPPLVPGLARGGGAVDTEKDEALETFLQVCRIDDSVKVIRCLLTQSAPP